MTKTFKETLISLQDKTYGNQIIKKTVQEVIWYWTKYLLIFSLIPFILTIASLTYFVPQLSSTLYKQLPDFEAGIKDHQFFTKSDKPVRLEDSDFLILIDSAASESALSQAKGGFVIARDHFYAKDETSTRTFDYSEIPDFSTSKDQLVTWTSQHQLLIWIVSVGGLAILGIIFMSVFWLYQFASFWFWAIILWITAKILKKTLGYIDAFKIIVYASVLPLLVSMILLVSPSDLISLLSFGVFVFFAASWLNNLKQSNIK